MILVVGVLAGTYYLTRTSREPRPPQFIAGVMWAYTRNAVASFERDGPSALNSFLDHAERDAGIRAHLFDAGGTELAGREATPGEREIASQAFRSGSPVTKKIGNLIYEASPMIAEGNRCYAFVAAFPFGPSGPVGALGPPRQPRPPGPINFLLGDTFAALVLRVVAVILTAGILCYLLARYIVAPVVKLRAVTRQVAGGDLSARVGPLLGTRRDELADMGRDFDVMAGHIQDLVNWQRRLLGDISHELRSPLARLALALELARGRAGEGAASALDRIESEAESINEMIGQLLTLARWERGLDGERWEPFDLTDLVREVAEDANFEAHARGREVLVLAPEECQLTGSPVLVRSAVENVVRNAVRYAPEKTAVEILVRRQPEESQSLAVITVRDKGPGVPESALADLFRPFYRVEEARDRESGGTGLGLAITERYVRMHGGTVTAANAPDGGLIVEIRLPTVPPKPHREFL